MLLCNSWKGAKIEKKLPTVFNQWKYFTEPDVCFLTLEKHGLYMIKNTKKGKKDKISLFRHFLQFCDKRLTYRSQQESCGVPRTLSLSFLSSALSSRKPEMSGSWEYQWFNMLVLTQKFCSSRVISLAGKCDSEMSWLTGAACDIKIWWGPFNWSQWFSSKVRLFGSAPASFSPVIAAVPPSPSMSH